MSTWEEATEGSIYRITEPTIKKKEEKKKLQMGVKRKKETLFCSRCSPIAIMDTITITTTVLFSIFELDNINIQLS